MRLPFAAVLVAATGVTAVSRPVRAQDPVPPTPPAAAVVAPAPIDSLVTFERPNGALLRAGRLVYHLTVTRSGVTTPAGDRTVDVSEASAGGAPAWMLAESRTGTRVETRDSLLVARADLTPIRWSASTARAQLGVSFTADSAFGAMQSYQGRASFSTGVPKGALLTAAMVERIVELLPLHIGYRAGAALLMFDTGSARVTSAELAVDREEARETVPGVMEDCWLVTLRAGVLEERLWVAKATSRVVRTEQATSSGLLTAVLSGP